MRKRILLFVSILVLVFGLGTGAWATTYHGSLSSSSSFDTDTLHATPPWAWDWDTNKGAVLCWDVYSPDDNNSDYWLYEYTFYAQSKEISHVIIEVSDNFLEGNIKDGTTKYEIVKNDITHYYPELNDFSQANGNPGMPGQIKGLKWDIDEDVIEYSWRIVTDRAPMWGDFYAKDGTYENNTNDVYAYNTGFGYDTTEAIGNGNASSEEEGLGWICAWVLVPDTTTQVPEPTTLLLLGLGLIGLAGFRRR